LLTHWDTHVGYNQICNILSFLLVLYLILCTIKRKLL
jgi:hypothetical protein